LTYVVHVEQQNVNPPATSFRTNAVGFDFTDTGRILLSVNKFDAKFAYFFVTAEPNPYSVDFMLYEGVECG